MARSSCASASKAPPATGPTSGGRWPRRCCTRAPIACSRSPRPRSSAAAKMTEALSLSGSERVLEIGTGSGYQAAVLSLLAKRVYSIEIIPELATRARERLRALGYAVYQRTGDGYRGWPEEAPFDRI